MNNEKGAYKAGLIIAAVSVVGFVGIIAVLEQRIKSLEKVVNSLPDRLLLALRKASGL